MRYTPLLGQSKAPVASSVFHRRLLGSMQANAARFWVFVVTGAFYILTLIHKDYIHVDVCSKNHVFHLIIF